MVVRFSFRKTLSPMFVAVLPARNLFISLITSKCFLNYMNLGINCMKNVYLAQCHVFRRMPVWVATNFFLSFHFCSDLNLLRYQSYSSPSTKIRNFLRNFFRKWQAKVSLVDYFYKNGSSHSDKAV